MSTLANHASIDSAIVNALAGLNHNNPLNGLLSVGGQFLFSPAIEMHDDAVLYVFATENGHTFAHTRRNHSQLIADYPRTLREEILKRLGTAIEPTPEYLPIGCIFDGAHGQEYNDARLLELATAYGWVDAEEGLGRVDHLEEIADTDPDELQQYRVEEATEYLEDFAPAGYYAGWHEGNYGVWPEDEDSEE
jgi:hypothetical protein